MILNIYQVQDHYVLMCLQQIVLNENSILKSSVLTKVLHRRERDTIQVLLMLNFLKQSRIFQNSRSHTFFITENDVRGANIPIYIFDRQDTITGEPFGDYEHIIFVNGAYNNPDDTSDLAKLIHDFACCNDEDMYFDLMAESTHYYKKTEKGVSHMCKLMEDMRNDEKMQEKLRTAIRMLADGVLTYEQIAKFTLLPSEKIKELAAQLSSITA